MDKVQSRLVKQFPRAAAFSSKPVSADLAHLPLYDSRRAQSLLEASAFDHPRFGVIDSKGTPLGSKPFSTAEAGRIFYDSIFGVMHSGPLFRALKAKGYLIAFVGSRRLYKYLTRGIHDDDLPETVFVTSKIVE